MGDAKGLYDANYYAWQDAGADRSAALVVRSVVELLHPQNVIDVGCGNGQWLAAFRAAGVKEVLGLDGDYIDRDRLGIPHDQFRGVDLNQRVNVGRTFDLAISLEVAEHLPPRRAETFVDDLAGLSDVILFSAAQPLQGGDGHINERWPDYWAGLFEARGFTTRDFLRAQLWDADVEPWYLQNMLVFAREGRQLPHTPLPFRVVHPKQAARQHARILPWKELARNAKRQALRDARRIRRRLGGLCNATW